MSDFQKDSSIKKVFFKIIIFPFFLVLFLFLLVLFVHVLVRLNAISDSNLFVDLILRKELVFTLMFFCMSFLLTQISMFVILLNNFYNEGFGSFKVDKWDRPCDFHNFVYGKKIGTVPLEGYHLMQWWMPLTVRQVLFLGAILIGLIFVTSCLG